MKPLYLSSVVAVLLVMLVPQSHAQDLDLIITSKGDSIACHIDSITDTHVYFEMKIMSRWTSTYIRLAEVSEMEENAIHKGQYLYQPGTSIIDSEISKQIRRNSFYAGILSLNYSRRFGIRGVVTLGCGLVWIDTPGIVLESTYLNGKTRHFLETGVSIFWLFDAEEGETAEFYGQTMIGGAVRIGYRYQGFKGLLIRAAPQLIFFDGALALLPALSLGYSF